MVLKGYIEKDDCFKNSEFCQVNSYYKKSPCRDFQSRSEES